MAHISMAWGAHLFTGK